MNNNAMTAKEYKLRTGITPTKAFPVCVAIGVSEKDGLPSVWAVMKYYNSAGNRLQRWIVSREREGGTCMSKDDGIFYYPKSFDDKLKDSFQSWESAQINFNFHYN